MQEIEDLGAYHPVLGDQQPVIPKLSGPGPGLSGKGVAQRKAIADRERSVLFHRSENGFVVDQAHIFAIEFIRVLER